MRLAVLRERRAGEARVAATPDTVKKLIGLGLTVVVEAGAGLSAAISDEDFKAAGAEIAADAQAAARGPFGALGLLAWAAVGLPFAIGLYIAIQKAAPLF